MQFQGLMVYFFAMASGSIVKEAVWDYYSTCTCIHGGIRRAVR